MDVGVWCVDELAEAKGASPARVLQSLRTLQSLGIVVCVQQSPLKYRHVNAWCERGIELSEAEMSEIKAIDKGFRFAKRSFLVPSPQDWKDLWDGEYLAE